MSGSVTHDYTCATVRAIRRSEVKGERGGEAGEGEEGRSRSIARQGEEEYAEREGRERKRIASD